MTNLWIDLDNSPHVLLFAPIVRELEKRGVGVLITVRRFSQTEELATRHRLSFTTIGEHSGSGITVVKIASTLKRAAQLANVVRQYQITAAVSQGSRALVLAAKALRIPVLTLYDYEYASCRLFNVLSDRVAVPEAIPTSRLTSQGLKLRKLLQYPGLKEEAYIYGFKPDRSVIDELQLDRSKVVVTVRPPARWAHYSSESSEAMFRALLDRLMREPDVQVVVPARTAAQADELRTSYQLDNRFRILTRAVDGLSLMWYSDLVFSGGGTMTREAALLGLNVFTIFGGRMGAADELLIREGRLKSLRHPEELELVKFCRRTTPAAVPRDPTNLANWLANSIVEFLASPQTITRHAAVPHNSSLESSQV